jgi:hypothetical protein
LNNEEETFLTEGLSPDGKWLCVFEDDGETGYLYLLPRLSNGKTEGIADALWIYNQISPPINECENVYIIWSDYSTKSGIIVDGECWGMIDISSKRKLSALREDDCIKTISLETWEEGIPTELGEPLYLEVRN